MRFNLLMVVLLVAVTLSLAQNRAKKNRCASNGGNCVAKSRVGKKCERLPFTCPKKSICCKKNSIVKRKCRVRTDCLKVNGTCISAKSNTCASTTQDDLCKGASCTCCPNSLTRPICKTKKICSKNWGYCMPRWESSKCDGTHDKSLCKGRYCTCCISGCQCGVANEGKIEGGEEVMPHHKYPWLVPLFLPSIQKKSFCGGTIISDRYILTAAHCVIANVSTKDYAVGIAEHNQASDEDDIPGVTVTVPVKKIIKHEMYYNITEGNDIALFKLETPLDLTAYKEVKPICLPKDDSKTYEGKDGIAAGWGRTEYSGNGSEIPLEIIMSILSPECESDRPENSEITESMICTVSKEGSTSVCKGDSGGPLMVKEGEMHVIVGIASFLYLNKIDPQCARPNVPYVFTRVSKFLDWIKENTADGKGCSYP